MSATTITAPHQVVPDPAQRPTAPTGPAAPPSGSGTSGRGSFLRRTFLGRSQDPRWARPALWGLLLAAAALYLVNLTNSGYANDFYAAAVKSGTQSVTAWIFGSLDSANAITVDKPPASLWLMVLSARIFGFSSFSLLLPQALMGVGTVAVTYAAVKRFSGHAAGLIAGGLILTVPAATLIFRFDNPDAFLVLLMTLASYCVVRAIEHSGDGTRRALRWMVWAGAALGFAFLAKMMQGLLVLPALGLAYLIAANGGVWQRIRHLLAGALAVVVASGWFIALVALWPASSRPYIGGSENNSLWELALGYNGLGRIFGSEGNGGGGGFGGTTGILRMFSSNFGTFTSWLLPAAIIGLVAGLVFTLRMPRTDRIRASLVLWGGSLVVTYLVFAFMEGTIHEYYTVALAPPMAATIAVAATELWRGRSKLLVRLPLALMIAATGAWGFVLLRRDVSGWLTVLPWIMVIGSLTGATVFAMAGNIRKIAVIAVLVGVLTGLSGTAAYSIATASQGHTGSIPSVGPSGYTSGGMGGMGGGIRTGAPTGTGTIQVPGGTGTIQVPTGVTGTGGFGGRGGSSGSTNTELVALLDGTTSRWSAAVLGDQSATGYILSTDTAVMAIGGWSGTDPSITLAQFQQYVADGDISYFIAGGGMGGGMGGGGNSSGVSSQITAWVEANFTSSTVGGTTVYDLSSATSTS